MRVHAPAKVNLHLHVGPRRRDGYHPLDSYIAKITRYDRVDLRPRTDGRVSFACEGVPCGPDSENLALRAAVALAAGRDVPGADIALHKEILPGRGLGGGSSDAAAVLAGLNELWELNLHTDTLLARAAALGSDVPLFLGPPAARMTGRGEVLTPVEVPDFWVLLCLPPFACSTAEAYRVFDQIARAGSPAPPENLLLHEPPSGWARHLENDLAPAAERIRPELADLRKVLGRVLGAAVHVTGSGSGLFVLFDQPQDAAAALAAVPDDLPGRCLLAARNPW